MDRSDIKGTGVLLFFAVMTAFVFNNMSPYGITIFGQWEEKKGVISANSKINPIDNSIEIISSGKVLEIIQAKQRIVLDVREPESYDQGHIPSALSFPLIHFDENISRMLSAINAQDPLLIYCSSAECTDSHTFAQHLESMGFKDVKVFSGGFRQWEENGYEISKRQAQNK